MSKENFIERVNKLYVSGKINFNQYCHLIDNADYYCKDK